MVLHYDGTSWQPVPSNTTQELNGIVALSDRVIAVSPGTLIEHQRGTPLVVSRSLPAAAGSVYSIFELGRRNVFAAVDSTVYRFDGALWTDLAAPSNDEIIWSVWAAGPNAVFAAGVGGMVLRYDGSMWHQETTNITDDFNWIWGTSATNVYASGDVGTLVHYDGTRWTTIPTNVSGWLYGVWGSGPNDVFAVGEDSAVLHFDGSGWQSLAVEQDADFWGVWGSGPKDVYLMADLNGVMHYDGRRFSTISTTSRRSFNYASGTSRSNAFGVEYRGQGVFHFNGVDWTEFKLPAITALNVHASSAGAWVTGTEGKVYFVDQDCASRETSCSDRWDNDCDGKTNCDDSDCATSPACATGGLCQTLRRVSCNTTNAGSTLRGSPRLERYACASRLESGRELSWEFEAPRSGDISLALTSPQPELDVVVLGAADGGACDPNGSCLAATEATDGGRRTTTFRAEAGKRYWFMLDGAERAAGSFELEVNCP